MFDKKKDIAFQEICKELKKIKKRLNIKKYAFEQTYYEEHLSNKVRIYYKKFSFEINKDINELEDIKRIKFKKIKTKKDILNYYINNIYNGKLNVQYTDTDLMCFTYKVFNFYLKDLKLTKTKDFDEIIKIKDINWELFFDEKIDKKLNPEDEVFTIKQKAFKLVIAKKYFIFFDKYSTLFFEHDINFLKNKNFEIFEDYFNNLVFHFKDSIYIYTKKEAFKYKYFDFIENTKTDKRVLKDGNLLLNIISSEKEKICSVINKKKILYNRFGRINRNDEFYLTKDNYIILDEEEYNNNYKVFKNNLIFNNYEFTSLDNLELEEDIFILSSQYNKVNQEELYYDLIVICHYNDIYTVKRSFLKKYKFDLKNIPLEKIKEENELLKMEVNL